MLKATDGSKGLMSSYVKNHGRRRWEGMDQDRSIKGWGSSRPFT